MTDKVTLTLPVPPTDNRYYGKPKGARHKYVTKSGKAFKHDVAVLVAQQGYRGHFGLSRLAMRVDLFLDRGGDIQNRLKGLCDALEESHLFSNDQQIDDLRVVRRHRVKGGRCEVTLWRMDDEGKVQGGDQEDNVSGGNPRRRVQTGH
jgi:crossover junction endodeoxyribonuclease RusA